MRKRWLATAMGLGLVMVAGLTCDNSDYNSSSNYSPPTAQGRLPGVDGGAADGGGGGVGGSNASGGGLGGDDYTRLP